MSLNSRSLTCTKEACISHVIETGETSLHVDFGTCNVECDSLFGLEVIRDIFIVRVREIFALES